MHNWFMSIFMVHANKGSEQKGLAGRRQADAQAVAQAKEAGGRQLVPCALPGPAWLLAPIPPACSHEELSHDIICGAEALAVPFLRLHGLRRFVSGRCVSAVLPHCVKSRTAEAGHPGVTLRYGCPSHSK